MILYSSNLRQIWARMPPSPVFNWLAVAHSALVILDHALQHRAAQVARVGSIRVSQGQGRPSALHEREQGGKAVEELVTPTDGSPPPVSNYVQPSSLLHANEAWLRQIEITATPLASLLETSIKQQVRETTKVPEPLQPISTSTALPTAAETKLHEADSHFHTADMNPSRLATPSPQDLQLPVSETPPHDVFLNPSLNLL